MRLQICIVTAILFATALAATSAASRGSRFYPDDPIARTPEHADASGAQPDTMHLFYEYTYNLFAVSRRVAKGIRAQNVNTIDEVPDSSWYTNRIGAVEISPEQIQVGPIAGQPPSPEAWVIVRDKLAGTNPGFTARDANGDTWFLQFDARERPGGSTAAIEVANKIFWALGYNEIETFITTFDPARATIDPAATTLRPSGARTPLAWDDIRAVLERAARNPDGTYRASAGRALSGKVLGPFRYEGTRPDDPNDLVPHQHRRELRALRVFGAWLNLVDLKALNTLDTLVDEDGRTVVKHYLQDVGSSLGMANNPHEWDQGWEYFYEGDSTWRRFRSLGFDLSPWQTIPYTEHPSVGLFEGDRFDPRTWKPQTPTPAYVELRADDAFWAAQRVAAFTDELIRAAVHAGQYGDAAAEQHVASVLMKRRDKILSTYLPAINPIVNPALAPDGTLQIANAAVAAGVAKPPSSYHAAWGLFDNETGDSRPIGDARSPTGTLRAPAPLPTAVGTFVRIDLSAESDAFPSWQHPVRTYFRRTTDGWQLVGLERMPEQASDSESTRNADRRTP